MELDRLESDIWDLISTYSCVILAMAIEEEASFYESQVAVSKTLRLPYLPGK